MGDTIKKILKRVLIIISLVISITVVFTLIETKPTFADSGFGTSYSGGSRSSGGSSYSSGSSYRGGSSYSGSDYSSNSNGKSSGSGFIIGIIVFLIIIGISYYLQRNQYNVKQPLHYNFDDKNIEDEIKQHIPDFNKEEFLNNGYKIYCDVQEAWMNFKLEDVRDIITDELYAMYESQLTTLEVKGEQNVMKDFALQKSFLKGVDKENNTITITTGYIIEFYDYIVEKETGKVLRGTANTKVRVTYEMKFRQTLDESKKITKCPNCGAEVDINTSTVCSYCRTKLVTENTKWVLTEKKTINQEYV